MNGTQATTAIRDGNPAAMIRPEKWEQVRNYLSRKDCRRRAPVDVGAEQRWMMCRRYKSSLLSVSPE